MNVCYPAGDVIAAVTCYGETLPLTLHEEHGVVFHRPSWQWSGLE
jgi:hypothetical protein